MIINKTIEDENIFTPWRLFTEGKNVDVSVSGVSDSTVTLQRKFKKYGADVLDVDTWTANDETYFTVASTAWYRIGVKSGEYGTDTVKVKLVV